MVFPCFRSRTDLKQMLRQVFLALVFVPLFSLKLHQDVYVKSGYCKTADYENPSQHFVPTSFLPVPFLPAGGSGMR